MKKLTLALTLLSCLLLTTVAMAHGGHRHDAKGKIVSVDAERLTLETLEDETLSFAIAGTTTFMRGEEGSSSDDVEVGERAVVIYEKKDGGNVAIEVKLGPKKK